MAIQRNFGMRLIAAAINVRIITLEGEIMTRFYIGDVEIITLPDGKRKIKRSIGNAVLTYDIDVSNKAILKKVNYLHKDHLGSVHAITDENGSYSRYSFDAFGKRRDAINWSALSEPDLDLFNIERLVTNRGYTGHEQLDEVGLIHMNGRVYDPMLGRFLQADPNIQEPGNTQNP